MTYARRLAGSTTAIITPYTATTPQKVSSGGPPEKAAMEHAESRMLTSPATRSARLGTRGVRVDVVTGRQAAACSAQSR